MLLTYRWHIANSYLCPYFDVKPSSCFYCSITSTQLQKNSECCSMKELSIYKYNKNGVNRKKQCLIVCLIIGRRAIEVGLKGNVHEIRKMDVEVSEGGFAAVVVTTLC